jgi:hypothetical protein
VIAFAVGEVVLEKVTLGPVVGAVNVTVTPLVGVPLVVTVATSATAKVPFTAWLCGVPLVAVIDSTGMTSPTVFT